MFTNATTGVLAGMLAAVLCGVSVYEAVNWRAFLAGVCAAGSTLALVASISSLVASIVHDELDLTRPEPKQD